MPVWIKITKMKNFLKYFLKLLSIFLGLLLIYAIYIQLWKLSSPNYPPSGNFDHVTRIGPVEIKDWTGNRRMHD